MWERLKNMFRSEAKQEARRAVLARQRRTILPFIVESYQYGSTNIGSIANVSNDIIYNFHVDVHFKTVANAAMLILPVREFYDKDDYRLIMHHIDPKDLMPRDTLQFRLPKKQNVDGEKVTIIVEGKMPNGDPIIFSKSFRLLV